jgi:hypothetical protein
LQSLGYQGSTAEGVDPEVPGFHDFRGVRAVLLCENEENVNLGQMFERWVFPPEVAALQNKSRLRRMDEKWSASVPPLNGQQSPSNGHFLGTEDQAAEKVAEAVAVADEPADDDVPPF